MSKEKDTFEPQKSETTFSYKTRIEKLLQDQLTKFEIPTGNLDDKEWHQLLKGIASSKMLRTLVINDVVDDKRAGELAVVLEGNQSLTNIAIISALMSEKGENTIVTALITPEHPNLLEAVVHSGLGVNKAGHISHLQQDLEEMVADNRQQAQKMTQHSADRPFATEELERRSNAIEALRQSSASR